MVVTKKETKNRIKKIIKECRGVFFFLADGIFFGKKKKKSVWLSG